MDISLVFAFLYICTCCFNIRVVNCLTCLSCDSIIQPRHCHEVTVCSQNEVCGVEKLRSSMGYQAYQLGCVSKSICTNSTSTTGSRCRQCCNGDLCNAAMCGEPDYPDTRGPICYACKYHTDQQPCRTIQFCSENEECGITAVQEFGDTVLISGCKPKHACQDPNSPVPVFVGRRAASVPSSPTPTPTCGPNCAIHFNGVTRLNPVTPLIPTLIGAFQPPTPFSPLTMTGTPPTPFPPIAKTAFPYSTRISRIPPTTFLPISRSTLPYSTMSLFKTSQTIQPPTPSGPFSLPGIPPTPYIPTSKLTSSSYLPFWTQFSTYSSSIPSSPGSWSPPLIPVSNHVIHTLSSARPTSSSARPTSPPVKMTSPPAVVTSSTVTTRKVPVTTTASRYVCNKCCSQDLCNLNCSTTNLCATSSCKHGACAVVNATATCACSRGWLGTRCDKFDHCSSSPCRHGSCVTMPSSYSCSCDFGWSGKNCDVSTFTSYNCDFEIGLCTWTQSATDDFDWTRNSGSTGSSGTGPRGDHTTGNGYYMYIETSNGNTGYKADLVSKLLPPNAPAHPYCFGLALNMYGNQMGSINIYIKPERKTQFLIQHYKQITNDQTWHVRNITLPNQYRNFSIVVEGVRGTGYEGDAAIDDLTVVPGPC